MVQTKEGTCLRSHFLGYPMEPFWSAIRGRVAEPRMGFAQLAPAHAHLPQVLTGSQLCLYPTPLAFSLGVDWPGRRFPDG